MLGNFTCLHKLSSELLEGAYLFLIEANSFYNENCGINHLGLKCREIFNYYLASAHFGEFYNLVLLLGAPAFYNLLFSAHEL